MSFVFRLAVPQLDSPTATATATATQPLGFRHNACSSGVRLCSAVQAATPVWQLLIQSALDRGVDAIIDCGALLAGVQLR